MEKAEAKIISRRSAYGGNLTACCGQADILPWLEISVIFDEKAAAIQASNAGIAEPNYDQQLNQESPFVISELSQPS
jgi:hypothetical protein